MKNYFSIVIPTRDRFQTCKKTIRSVINQNFKNFELIIADNSIKEKGLLKSWLERKKIINSNIKFYETESDLPMPKNWENATLKASGRYILVLPDRWLMRPGVLQFLYDVNKEKCYDCIVWDSRLGVYDNGYYKSNYSGKKKIKATIKKSKNVIEHLLKFNGYKKKNVFSQIFPRALNSMFSAELAKKIRDKNEEMFTHFSCDYTSGFKTLMAVNEFLHIEDSMYASIGNNSNGQKSSVDGLKNSMPKEYKNYTTWRNLDIDAVFITVLNDIENTLKQKNNVDQLKSIKIENVLLSLLSEIHFKEYHGSPLKTSDMRVSIINYATQEVKNYQEFLSDFNEYDKINKPKYYELRKKLRSLGILHNLFSTKAKLLFYKDLALNKRSKITDFSLAQSELYK